MNAPSVEYSRCTASVPPPYPDFSRLQAMAVNRHQADAQGAESSKEGDPQKELEMKKVLTATLLLAVASFAQQSTTPTTQPDQTTQQPTAKKGAGKGKGHRRGGGKTGTNKKTQTTDPTVKQ